MSAILQRQDTGHQIPIDSAVDRRSDYDATVPLQPRDDGAFNADDAQKDPERLVLRCEWSAVANPRLGDDRSGQARLDALERDLEDARGVPCDLSIIDEPVRSGFILRNVAINRNNAFRLSGTLTFVAPMFADRFVTSTTAAGAIRSDVADDAAAGSDDGSIDTVENDEPQVQSLLRSLLGGS